MLSGIVFLLVIGCLLTAKGTFNEIIIRQGVNQANKMLNAELSVGELSGNPFTHLTLHKVRLVQENQEILSIETVELGYSLISLFKKEIAVDEIKISSPKLKVWQDSDSLWNVQKLMKPSNSTASEKSGDGFPYKLNIVNLECSQLSASICPLDSASILPKSLEASWSLSYLMKGNDMQLKMKNLAIQTIHPKLEIESLTFDFSSDSSSYSWDGLRLHMPHSELVSEGKYFPAQPFRSSGKISVDTLTFALIHEFMPGFVLKGNPSVSISATGQSDRINISAKIGELQQKAEISGWMKKSEKSPEYDLNLDVSNIDGSTWTGNPEYATKITGKLHAIGSGFDPEKSSLSASGNFSELSYLDKTLKNLVFEARKDSSTIGGNLSTDTWFGGLAADFRVADFLSRFRYSVLCSAKNIDLSKISFPNNLSSAINLKIKAAGEGMNPLKGMVKANIQSSNSTITKRPIDDFQTDFSYENGNYNLVDLNLNTPFFRLVADGNGNIQKENHVRFDFETKAFDDLLKLTGFGQYSLEGKIKGQFEGSAKNYKVISNVNLARFNSDSLFVKDCKADLDLTRDSSFRAESKLELGSVSMGNQVFKNLHASLNEILAEEISLGLKVDIDTVSINSKNLGALKAEALLFSDDSLRLDANFKLDSLSYLPVKTGASSLSLKSRLSKGDDKNNLILALHQLTERFNYLPFMNYLSEVKKDSAKIYGHLDLQNLSIDTLTVHNTKAELNMMADLNTVKGTMTVSVDSLNYNGFAMENSRLHTSFLNRNFRNELSIKVNDSIQGKSTFDINFGNNVEVGLHNLELRTSRNTWKGGGDSTRIIYGDNSMKFKNLTISANDQNYIKAEGNFALKGDENLEVHLRGFNLKDINKIAGGPIPILGNMDASLKLTGTALQPEIVSELNLKNLQVKDEKIDRIDAMLHFQKDTVEIGGTWNVVDTLMFEAKLKSPFHFSLENPAFKLPSPTDNLEASFKLNQFNLSRLIPFIPVGQIDIKGYVNSELAASGPLNNLKIDGFVNWKDGKFHLPEYGLLYDKVRINAGIKNDSIFIKEFKAEAGTGSLELKGYSRLDQQSYYSPKEVSLRLIGKEFKVVDSDRLQATINTNITLKNESGTPVFDGNLDVIRSEVNADAFISDYKKASDEEDLPMLIKAMERQSKLKAKDAQKDSIGGMMRPDMEFYNKLRGSFNITIPRNLWIRGKDMGIEVKGDLRAAKEGKNLVLFGTLEVKQGFYKLYGKKFDFKSGKITLTGDEDINPILEFVVAYSFRDYEKVLKSMEVKITGRLKDPQITFEMNGTKIDEQDALSYLIFGCSMSELSDGQESTLEINTSTIAKNVAFGQMSNVLKDAMQSSLKLDVVEIAGEDNWDAASVTVGKYINSNLYMSYQYTFALDKKTKIIEPQKISVEYQIFHFLSLKATNQSPNSGLDLIFKKEYK